MITSINLNSIPFLSSTDATRASMASKQIQQTLTSLNTEIPYVIGSEYRYLTDNSPMGIIIAEDDGKVIFKKDDLLIVFYSNLNKLEEIHVPPVKKTHGNYATSLRYCIDADKEFKKGDILVTYDCFINDIPTYGYNVFTAFLPFFGFNHEDAIVISESFANRAIIKFVDKIFIPIYEYTLMIPFYQNVLNSYIYFPSVKQQIKEDIVCCILSPKGTDNILVSSATMKANVQNMLKSINLSGLLSLEDIDNTKFVVNKIKTKLENGIINGIKIHRLRKPSEIHMIDKRLQQTLDKLYVNVYGKHITEAYQTLMNKFDTKYTEYILRKYYICRDRRKRGNINLTDACYLLEIEITKEDKTYYGDKFCNRYANKGVVSLIVPDELRPIALESNQPIDFIFNPFGVFSRMNLGQILEILISKPVLYCDTLIKQQPEKTKEAITWLNENVLKYIDKNYYDRVQQQIISNLDDDNFRNQFAKSIQETNLFVEAPCFAEIDIRNLIRNKISYKETILLPKELITFMKQKLKIELPPIDKDIYIPDVFCGPMYIQKLSKLASKIINARDLGVVKSITKQPTKGRAKSGGSRLGQMEIEALITNGAELAIKELLSVKSDWSEGKSDLIKQLTTTGEYHLPDNRTIQSRTKEVIDTQIKFLKE